MSLIDTTPIFNLKAVVRETGLKADTLRAWERRYGLPAPERTESGHRLYSQRDVEILKWLIERQKEGLSIGRAVDLWHQLEQEMQDPLAPGNIDSSSISTSAVQEMPVASANGYPSQIEDLRNAWVDACLKFDEAAAERALGQAFAVFPTETVCIHILQAGLSAIGQGWQQGRITVQQEHFASALALRRLEALLAGTPAPMRRERILIGCPADEEHTFIPLLLTLLLRRKGYDVVYLGANVPVRSLEVTIASTTPQLVVLTAQQLYTAANLLEMAGVLQASGIPLAYGGLIFGRLPDITKVIPGYYLGHEIDGAVQTVEQILLQGRLQPAVRQPASLYTETSEAFRRQQALIESEVWRRFADENIAQRHLARANANLSRNIQAALALGDMDYLGPDIDWIEELLVNHYQVPAELLHAYLAAYQGAVADVLGPQGRLITRWFQQLLNINEATGARMTVLRNESNRQQQA